MRKIKIFGWRIYISRQPMKKKHPHNPKRSRARRLVFEATGGHCMECGTEITYTSMHVHSKLDASHPAEKRYALENVIALCPVCNAQYQRERQKESHARKERSNGTDNKA